MKFASRKRSAAPPAVGATDAEQKTVLPLAADMRWETQTAVRADAGNASRTLGGDTPKCGWAALHLVCHVRDAAVRECPPPPQRAPAGCSIRRSCASLTGITLPASGRRAANCGFGCGQPSTRWRGKVRFVLVLPGRHTLIAFISHPNRHHAADHLHRQHRPHRRPGHSPLCQGRCQGVRVQPRGQVLQG